MIKKLLGQLLPFVAITLLFGAVFAALHINFIFGIIFGAAVQYIGFFIFQTVVEAVVSLKNKKLENERIKEFSYQGLEVECPCFKKHKDIVPIRFNTPNYYKCSDCKKTVSVLINAETAIVTEPVTATDIPIIPKLTNANS